MTYFLIVRAGQKTLKYQQKSSICMEFTNPATKGHIGDGVVFFKFLWEECKPELEHIQQADIDAVWKVLIKRSPRPAYWKQITGEGLES